MSKAKTAAQVYKQGLVDLGLMVDAAENAVLTQAGQATLITENINFFTKSFLISICAHLEMCVKEIVFTVATDLDERLSVASVPASIIEWRYLKKKVETAGLPPQNIGIRMTKKEVDDLVSGNVYRTKDALALVGVDLAEDKSEWEAWKEVIQSMVTRRNNIVHHNDDASDISLGDIRQYVISTVAYIDFILAGCEQAHKRWKQ